MFTKYLLHLSLYALCARYSYDYLDFFPFMVKTIIMITDQGRIACANVLSDLYAMGVVDCHNMLMLLAGGIDLDGNDEKHRHLYSSQWPRRCLRQRGTW